MALRALRLGLGFLGVLVLLAVPGAIYSCGPFLETAIFAFGDRPDTPEEDFAAGTLGIVRPEFRQAYLAVAYRYFAGLRLSNEQQHAAIAVWNRNVVPGHPSEDEAIAAWRAARNKVPNLPPAAEISPYAAVSKDQPYFQYLNCPGGAFENAVRTLDERSARFGAETENLRQWVSGQDQVFANCAGQAHVIPAALNSGDPLLRADRVYQIAAAYFYAHDFDQAAAEFDAIAQDRSSPWASISSYLAARALVRKANLVHKQNEAFDPAVMSEAQKRLEAILADPQASSIREPATRLLNFVRFRTEPDKRVAELDRMIVQPDVGKNFKQDLWDYALLLSHGERGGDPSSWVQTFQTAGKNNFGGVREQTVKDSISNWQKTKSLPWLIAALAASDSRTPNVQALMAAADGIPRSTPGYWTVRYYALRRIASGESQTARKQLDWLLANDLPLGSRNLFNEERLKVTTSLADFLQHASETPVPAQVDFNTGEEVPAETENKRTSAPLFNHHAAQVLVKRLPLGLLIQVAQSPVLPKHLRREVARSAWVRSVLVEDLKSASGLQSALEELDTPLWRAMEPFRMAEDAAEKHFAAVFIILTNPGMKPSVREGLLRNPTLGELDNYRDNWWCTAMTGGPNWGQSYADYNKDVNLKFVDRDPDFPFPAWLSEAEKAEAISQWKQLSAIGTAPNYLTDQVLLYAKQRPEDPRIPEALYLAVRSTHFGCANAETSKVSKAAFDFLHEHYPQSEWAAKTRYYY